MATTKQRGRPPHNDILTPAEWQVVHAAQHGMSNREIAKRRGVSTNAIKYHVNNALSKLSVSNRRVLKRWFRVPNDSALGQQEKTLDKLTKIGPIGQISRSVSDIGQAEEWYGNVLGLPHLYSFDKIAFYDCGGTRLFLTQQDDVSAGESILYLQVSDIESAYNDLCARGIEFTNSPHRIHTHADGTEEWMAFFDDPDGRSLAIMAQAKGQRIQAATRRPAPTPLR